MENKMLECSKKRWVVITPNYYKAQNIIEDIEKSCGKIPSKKTLGNHKMVTEFTDGTILKWIYMPESLRAYKFGKMWCDESIDKEILDCIILPRYFGKYEEIIWV